MMRVIKRAHSKRKPMAICGVALICCALFVLGLFAVHTGGNFSDDGAVAQESYISQEGTSSYVTQTGMSAGDVSEEISADSSFEATVDASNGTSNAVSVSTTTPSGKPTKVTGSYDVLTKDDIPEVSENEEGMSYVSGEVLILFSKDATFAQARDALDCAGLLVDDAELVACLEAGALYDAKITNGASVCDALSAIVEQDVVGYAQPNYLYGLLDDTDAEYSNSWSVPVSGALTGENKDEDSAPLMPQATIDDPQAADQWQLDAINAYGAWDTARTEGSVSVAVIDTGVDFDHEDLAGRVVTGYNSQDRSNNYGDIDGHGTHVSGIIAATTDNAIGVSGVSYNANIIAVQAAAISSGTATFTTSSLAEAFNYLLADADNNGISDLVEQYNLRVINMSLGGLHRLDRDPTVNALIDTAYYDQGILIVCGAGNDGIENVGSTNTFWPGDLDACMSVIALSSGLLKAYYSNYGDAKDIAAPGSYLLSTTYDGAYGIKSGTSMASPVVAGVAALVFSQDDSYTPDDVRTILDMTAQDIGEEGYDVETAWGCVDAEAAVTAHLGDNVVTISGGDHATISNGTTTANSFNETVSFGETISGTYTVIPDDGYVLNCFVDENGTVFKSFPTARITSAKTYTAVCVEDHPTDTTLTFTFTDSSLLQPTLNFLGDTSDGMVHNVTIDWGDGETSTGFGMIKKPSPYASTGSYIVTVTSDVTYQLGLDTSVVSSDYQKFLISVKTASNAQVGPSSFRDCSGLVDADLSRLAPLSSTDLSYLFAGCTSLKSADLTGMDVSGVRNMSYMFNECYLLTSIDMTGWDTSGVTDMNHMFCMCTSLESLDLSGFDTSSLTHMGWLFYSDPALASVDLSGWDTSRVTSLHCTFSYCTSLKSIDLSGLDTSSVTDMYWLFYYCSGLTDLDLSNFDTSNVTTMHQMFAFCSSLKKLDLSSFDTSSVTNMSYMFSRCSSLVSLNLSSFDTSSVTEMLSMFNCTSLRKIKLGSSFSFTGANSETGGERLCELPGDSLDLGYSVTGKWVNIDTGSEYAPDQIPNNVAATYYAQSLRNLTFTSDDFDVMVELTGDGTDIVPVISTDLLDETEYVVQWCADIDMGLAVVYITGVGNYSRTQSVTFSVVIPGVVPNLPEGLFGELGARLSSVELPDGWTWDHPNLTLSDIGEQYFGATYVFECEYGSAEREFDLPVTVIGGEYIDESMFDIDLSDEAYTGSPVTKHIESLLVEDVDYQVSYENNVDIGEATLIITGINEYRGTLTYTFNIVFIDRTELEEAIAQAETITDSGFLPQTWEYFCDALATAREVDANTTATQVEVDDAAFALKIAITSVTTLFDDVADANEWFFEAVYGMVSLGAITGYNATTFGVGDPMTRRDFVTVLWRYCEPEQYAAYDEPNAKNTTDLPDIADGQYYTGAANWAVAEGVVTGNQLADGTYIFSPDDPITFEQMVTIVARYSLGQGKAAAWDTTALDKGPFTDAASVSDYARGPMSWAIENGLVTGNNNNNGTYTLSPSENVARERVVTVLWRAIQIGAVSVS